MKCSEQTSLETKFLFMVARDYGSREWGVTGDGTGPYGSDRTF